MALSLGRSTASIASLSVRCSSADVPSAQTPARVSMPAAQGLGDSSAEMNAINPAASYSNVFWAKTFNTQIFVGENESAESVVRRFRKVCMEANIVNECRRRRYFENTQDIQKRKQKDAARLRKRFQRASGPRTPFVARTSDQGGKAAASKAEEDDDYWDAEVEL